MNCDRSLDENFNKRSTADDVIVVIKTSDNVGSIHEIQKVGVSPIEHMCNKCNKRYNSIEGLRRHLNVCNEYFATTNNYKDGKTSDNNPYEFKDEDDIVMNAESKSESKCECCGEDKRTAHKAGIKCQSCNKYFRYKESYELHLQKFHSEHEDALQCTKCDVKCLNGDVFFEHLSVHDSKISCSHCKKEFSRKYHLKRHILQTGCGGQKKNIFTCQVCNSSFSRKDNLREHLRNHIDNGVLKAFTCDYCNKNFRGKSTLIGHIRTHTGDAPFICSFCKRACKTKGALIKHERTHTGEKPYSCDKCKKAFSAKETLNRHLKTHSEDKPHVCLECGKTFIQSQQLRSHMFHHTGENGFKCKYCNASFNRKSRLLVHEKYVHENATKLKCTFQNCSKTFVTIENLKRHQLIHSGEKPHKCKSCEKSFRTTGQLSVHMRTHKREIPRSCPHCPRAYIRADSLLRHTRTKHPEDYKTLVNLTRKKKSEIMKTKLNRRFLKQSNGNDQSNNSNLIDNSNKTDDEERILESPRKSKNTKFSYLQLISNIEKLMILLIDENTLSSFGWPESSVDKVLELVIKKCGCTPVKTNTLKEDNLRENLKLLLTVIIDDEDMNKMIDNYSVDEVIVYLLCLGKID